MGSWAASDLKARVVNLALTTNVIVIDSEAERASFAALVIGEALRRPRTLPSNPISFLVDSKGRLEGWVNSFHPRYPCHLGMVAEVGRLKGPEHTQRIPGSYDVVFLEAGTLCELIELAYVVLDEFPLLILDNCRCAKASHPYFQLMRSHYHPLFETARRPRVVGLTSTVFVSGVGADAVSVLETMLCADIYVLVTHGWSPTDEAVLNYRAPQKYLAGPPLRAIRDARLSRGFEALSRKALRVNGQLGPYGAALYLDHLMPPQLGALTPDRGLAEAFRSNHAFAEEIGWQLASNPYAFSPQHIAPKVRVLLDYLLAVRATLPRGIILVPIRRVGLGLWLLIQAPKRFETIRCACLFEVGIRHGVETAAMGGPAFQAELRKFRPGTTQLLIVARAAEDGIPILACDVVVQFDLVPNFYAYSQFRAKVGGRTRQQALLVESGGGDRALRKLKATQAEVYRWYLTLSAAQVGGERATRREMGGFMPNRGCPIKPTHEPAVESFNGGEGGLTFQPAPKVPEFWLPLESHWPAFWINVVQLDPSSKAYQPFALITRKPLPALHLLKIPSAPSSIVAQVALASEPFIPDLDHVDTLSDFTSRIFGVILNDPKGSRDSGVPFLLAPLTCRHEPDQAWRYVDWEMVRTKGLTPLRCDASVRDLVVCDGSGSLGSLYYHKRDVTSCEVDVNTLEPVLKGNRKKKPIPEDLMWVHWLSGPFARSMMMLPALMNRVDSILLLKQFKAKLGIEFVKDEFLLEAVTFRSAHQEVDYERLEFLGDTFLKLLASVDVCIRAPDSSPEQLFNGYVSIARNSSLSTAGQGVNLQAYFVTQPFDTGAWRPPPFSRLKPTPKSVPLGKSLADVVEATLGASLLSVGESQTIRCAKALGIPIGEFYSWGDYRRVYLQLSPPPNHKAPINLGGVQALLNYHFSNPGYLAEALAGLLTHPPTVGYRRLVFLGDALLNYFTVTYLFLSYPEATPGELTATKSACLRRATLVRAMQSLGLHQPDLDPSPSMHPTEASANSELPPRLNLSSKALGNTLHALIGAILMDSGFELEAALAFFNSHLRPFYQQLIPEANLISEGKVSPPTPKHDTSGTSLASAKLTDPFKANLLLTINPPKLIPTPSPPVPMAKRMRGRHPSPSCVIYSVPGTPS